MSKSKIRTRVRSTQVDENTLTAKNRDKSLLAHSPAVRAAMASRTSPPLILPEDVKLVFQGKMSHKDVMDLSIDTRYQRDEVTSEVNQLIHVLLNGGQIPDPVTVAERSYGDKGRYVVDGQQRWWAHVDTGKPMQVRIYKVDTFEQELTLFHVLNNTRKLSARTRLKSWPGPSGKAMDWLMNHADSPLRGLISTDNNKGDFPMVTVMRGLTSAIVGITSNGAVDVICTAFDRQYQKDPDWAMKAVHAYAYVISNIFEKGNPMRHLPAIALGRACYATWKTDAAWRTPTPKEFAKLKRVDWERLAPGFATQWLPLVQAEVRKLWEESVDPDEFARRSKAKDGAA